MKTKKRSVVNFSRYGYFFIAPFLIVFVMLQLFPIFYTLVLGFTDFKGMAQNFKFIGLHNFYNLTYDGVFPGLSENDAQAVVDKLTVDPAVDAEVSEGDNGPEVKIYSVTKNKLKEVTEALASYGVTGDAFAKGLKQNVGGLVTDSFFWKAFANNWIIWSMNFVPQLLVALLLAVVFTDLKLKIAGGSLFKSLFYIPNVLNTASVAVLFATLFYWPVGPINQFLVHSGIVSEAINFFRSSGWTRSIVAFIQFWMWYGSTMIILIAGISGISPSLYEAAYVDGAGPGQMFFGITLPLLRPVMLYIMVTSLIGGMQMFDIPYLLTNRRGDPDGSIMTTPVYIYIQAFTNANNYSYASAVSFGLFLLTLVLSLVVFTVLRDPSDGKKLRGASKKSRF